MTVARLLLAAGFALAAAPALAAFQTLPTTGARVIGSPNPSADPFFLSPGAALPGGLYDFPAYLVPISPVRITTIELPDEDEGEVEEVGSFYDYVLRDTTDNTLVFASRIVLGEEGEINDIFRSGFFGYSVAAAWTFGSDFDDRLRSAARSNSGLGDPDAFDPDVVNLRTDVNVEEDSPNSGWFFVKAAAGGYIVKSEGIRIYQAGEEFPDEPFSFYVDGYAPLPVPEPTTYGMLLSGMMLLAFVARRRARASRS